MIRLFLHSLSLALILTSLSGCVVIGNAKAPISSQLVPAKVVSSERTLIVVLPGFGVDADSVRKNQIPEALQTHWPEADVLLTNATFAYYSRGALAKRLHEDVIQPARAQGYQNIWLAGGSMGGTGVLFYEYTYPGELNGLVMMAPWLGSSDILKEVELAGGILQWNPGPVPEKVDGDNFEREMWRTVKSWTLNPALGQRVWLICGTDDRLLEPSRLLAPALPAGHYLEIPGGHDWDTFQNATRRIVEQIRHKQSTQSVSVVLP